MGSGAVEFLLISLLLTFPQISELKQQKLTFSPFWRLRVQDKRVGRGWFFLRAVSKIPVPCCSQSFWWLLAIWCFLARRCSTMIAAFSPTWRSPFISLCLNFPPLSRHLSYWILRRFHRITLSRSSLQIMSHSETLGLLHIFREENTIPSMTCCYPPAYNFPVASHDL